MNICVKNETNSLCRTCMQVLDDLARHLATPELLHKLSSTTGLYMDEEDSWICESCIIKVNEFYIFKTMCLASAQKLNDLREEAFELQAPEEIEISMSDIDKEIFHSERDFGNESVPKRKKGRPPKLKSEKMQTRSGKIERHQEEYEANIKEQESSYESIGEECTNSKSNKISRGKLKRRSSERKLSGSVKSSVFQCDICPMRFFVEHRLVAHKRAHEGLVPYPCLRDDCEKSFNRWHCLSEHMKQHDGTNSFYACEMDGCKKVYKHKPTLAMHMRKFHKRGPELKSHVCEICGKVFKTSAVLNDHHYTHKDKSELPYACDQADCLRRFSNKEKLKVHLMRHAGIKNFVCTFCGMRKTTRNELKVHINYHTLERTFPCSFCDHVCNSAGNLKMHVRTIHERAKDYACRFCERSFAKMDTRKYHEMTHTGERPYTCSECGKRFTQPAALRTHKKMHQRHRLKLATVVDNNEGNPKINELQTDVALMQFDNMLLHSN